MDDNVYLGRWTNWSRGPILGQTLTTTKAGGNLLIAFTAVFVGFVGARLWKVVSLVIHRSYSTQAPKSTLHYQSQIILRNSSSAESSFSALVRLLWAWRKSRTRHLIRLVLLILLSAILFAAFTIAGGFSANISTAAGDEVLLKTDHCGPVAVTPANLEERSLIAARYAEETNNAANYAQQCGISSSGTSMGCNKYVVPRLPVAVMNNKAVCPFHVSLCRKAESTMLLDTGYLDSNDHLGLNRPGDLRFEWRYVLQCTPLQTDGYTSHTFADSRASTTVSASCGNLLMLHYSYRASDTFGGQVLASSDMIPIPELQRQDGDVSIAFLSGQGVLFQEIFDDDWYRAIVFRKNVSSNGVAGSLPAYGLENSASPIGCVEQYQWCNSAYSRDVGCGPLASRYDALYGAAALFNLTSEDLDPERPISSSEPGSRLIWPVLTLFTYPVQISRIWSHLGVASLASQSRLYDGLQNSIPINQWQLDVQKWFDIILSAVQASFIDTVLGPDDPQLYNLTYPPVNHQEQRQCQSQKIRSSRYMSFSILGLVFTFSVGGLIVLVSFFLEPLLFLLYKHFNYRPYAQLEWSTNANLQLHRLAHEELGFNEWFYCDREVPITNGDVTLAGLDLKSPHHPILSRGGYTGSFSRHGSGKLGMETTEQM
ncbi:hypothetical protein GGR57DRAFT_514510 [Xylariaceae sp. FL1272]|nr:hypothetical protein GGR57DRAFT_514510 [Xylariaceae sp. FL1272]